MTSKTIIAALAGAIVAFLLGWLLFGILLDSFYKANTYDYPGLMKAPPNLVAIAAFNFTWCLLFALIFRMGNITTFSSGFLNGLWIGFLVVLSIDLSYYAFMYVMHRNGYIVDILVNTVFWGIVGGVIAMVLGMGKKPAAAAQ